MKVILQEDLKGKGKKGELVNVSDGYARNYLIPRGLAVMADSANMNVMKMQDAAKKRKEENDRKAALELAEKLGEVTVKITAKGGETGKLFGSVTTKEIVEELMNQFGIEVDRKKIVLEDDIKSFGNVTVEAKIYPEISATFYVSVFEE